MKKLLVAMVLLACSTVGFAAGKVAVVNFEQAMMNTDYAKAQIAEIEKDPSYKENMERAQKIQLEGVKLAEKYQKEAPTMSATQKAALENQIKDKRDDFEHIARKLQEVKEALMQSVMQEMSMVASQAAKELIDAEGIGLLLNGNPQIILHADTSYDVSAKLTERINRLHSKSKK